MQLFKKKPLSEWTKSQSNLPGFRKSNEILDAEIKGWNDAMDYIVKYNLDITFKIIEV
jgi:hypothetical protein